MILVEDRSRLLDVDLVGGLAGPRQSGQPVEIRPDHAVLRTCLRNFRQTVQLAVGGLLYVLGHPGGVDLLAQFVELGELRVDFAEFFLNGTQLLAEVKLALVLLHLALDVALNLVAQLDDFQFLGEQHREFAHPLGRVSLFEEGLTVGGFETHGGCDEVRQHRRVGDVLDLHFHLARSLRKVRQELLKEPAEVALHRDELFVFDGHVGQLGIGGDHVRRDLRKLRRS